MKVKKVILAVALAIVITGCTSLPQATGEHAQAVTDASNVVSATTVEEVLTNNINVPPYVIGLLMLASTFVPNPFELVGRAFKMLTSGVLGVFNLFKMFK